MDNNFAMMWKEICENFVINEDGVVKHLAHKGKYIRNGKVCYANIKERVLSKHMGSMGYFRIDIKGVTEYVHRLVAKAFIPNLENKPQVNHKNGVKTDNRIHNLEWATSLENIRHAYDTGLSNNKGERNGFSKLKDNDVQLIKQFLLMGLTQSVIAKEFNLTQPTISAISTGYTWSHINA